MKNTDFWKDVEMLDLVFTEEDRKEIERAKSMPITFDDDCPEVTPELAKRFHRVNPRRDESQEIEERRRKSIEAGKELRAKYTPEYIKSLEEMPIERNRSSRKRIKEHYFKWDPDFTKVTDKEKEILDQSEQEMMNGEFISEEDFWSQD